jgi:hypothetical protein
VAIDTRDGLASVEGGAVSTPKQTGFLIGGTYYDVPRLETFDLDEEQILFDISGVIQMDFVPAHPEASDEEKAEVDRRIFLTVRNPSFKRALIHIAYRRQHREMSFDEIASLVGRVSAVDSELALLRGDADPPATTSQKQPENSSPTSEPSKSEDSGRGSRNGSDEAVEHLPLTGTGR